MDFDTTITILDGLDDDLTAGENGVLGKAIIFELGASPLHKTWHFYLDILIVLIMNSIIRIWLYNSSKAF